MDHVQKFRRYAEECRRMARLTNDGTERATWKGLADRWERCAEAQQAMSQAAAGSAPPKRRHQARRWSVDNSA
jgi:hypothetical protein